VSCHKSSITYQSSISRDTCDQMGYVFSVVFRLTNFYGPCVEEQRLRRRVHPIGTTVLPFLCVTGRSTPVFLTTRALESVLVCVPTCFSSRVSTGYIRTHTRHHIMCHCKVQVQ